MRYYLKYIFTLLCCGIFLIAAAQKSANFSIKNIKLPPELSYYDNQFSGMYIQQQVLYLLSESRLQDSAQAKLYAIKIADITTQLADSNFILPYKKIIIANLAKLSNQMQQLGTVYEGLEAMVISGSHIYFTVETTTPSSQCYLLKGTLHDSVVTMDENVIIPLPKPLASNGSHIYNAGFEALSLINNSLYAFFEYNSFAVNNWVLGIRPTTKRSTFISLKAMQQLPFRLTDITQTSKHNFTAINYFYKGAGNDEVYRVPTTDTINDTLIRDNAGYKSYARLIQLKYKKNKFVWKPLWQLPASYMAYNWECIAAYRKGYFILNDKYTAARPYQSTLLYLQPIAEK